MSRVYGIKCWNSNERPLQGGNRAVRAADRPERVGGTRRSDQLGAAPLAAAGVSGLASLEVFRADVAAAMEAIRTGDPGGIEALFTLALRPVRRMLASALGRAGYAIAPDQLDDLARNAIVDLAGLAGTWRPDGGALPWNWAKQRIIVRAFSTLGGRHDSLEAMDSPPPEPLADGPGHVPELALEDALQGLARRLPEASLLQSGLALVASTRDRRVWLDYVTEQAAGSPSPAGTVARTHGLSECNVRKIVQRVRTRLRDLAARDANYSALGDFPAVAA